MIANITDQNAGTLAMTLGEIEKLTARLADASTALDDQLAEYERELQAVNDKHLRPLKRLAAETAASMAELHSAIEGGPHLFIKPRTITLHGFKIGFSYSKGKLVIADEETTIKLLRKKFPELAEALIRTEEEVNKDGVKTLGLAEKQLSALGMSIDGAGDGVLIDRAAGDIEKLIAKLTKKLVEATIDAK